MLRLPRADILEQLKSVGKIPAVLSSNDVYFWVNEVNGLTLPNANTAIDTTKKKLKSSEIILMAASWFKHGTVYKNRTRDLLTGQAESAGFAGFFA